MAASPDKAAHPKPELEGEPEAKRPKKTELVGFGNFKRENPMSDKFETICFDHLEFYCGDVENVSRRFALGLGLQIVSESNQSSDNQVYSSTVLKSSEVKIVMTAPYADIVEGATGPHPGYKSAEAREFFNKHGVAVRAVGIVVGSVAEAYKVSVENGAEGVLEPSLVGEEGNGVMIAEVKLYGDAVLRYIERQGYTGHFLPGYVDCEPQGELFGLHRIDHVVGNVPNILDQFNYLEAFTGWHEFAEFTTEDVGTVDSGLNSIVMASNNEMVLLPINEPTFGTPRKSQIQTYLEQNVGAGVQHIAIKTDDIFDTLKKMRSVAPYGFSFMPKPEGDYYEKLPEKCGDVLTKDQYQMCDELGILVDIDDQGVLLQIFTQPLGDRSTVFIEIIQRLCFLEVKPPAKEVGGCGGFGKGNFGALFKSIEDYEREHNIA